MRNLVVKMCVPVVIFLNAAFSAGTASAAAEKELIVKGGGGYENNVYYSSTDEKGSVYGLFEAGYRYKRPLPDSDWKFLFDGFYSGKLFVSETGANDHFASFFMSVNRDFGKWELGVSNDPQYTRFVTSDTNGGVVSSGKQRIYSDKIRVFAIFEFSDSSEIEGAVGFRKRDYKDSNSDYGEVSFDTVYRRRVSDNMRLNFGLVYERRDFKNRAAVNASGSEVVSGKTLLLKRLRPFFKVNYSPDKRSRYSFKYRYKSNVDSFEDWFTYRENSFLGQAEHLFGAGISLEGSVRLDLRNYEKKTGDTGILDEKITTAKISISLPASFKNSSWFMSIDYSGFTSDQKSFEYDNSGIMLGIKIAR